MSESSLSPARAKEKDGRRLRAAGNDQAAIEAYEEARELYAETGLQYSRDSAVADDVMSAIKRCDTLVSNIKHPKAKRAAATTARPNCLACDKPLRRYKHDGKTFNDGTPQEWGDYGDQRFCGLACGWRWACKHAPMPKMKSRK
jgi:hypothetical protein